MAAKIYFIDQEYLKNNTPISLNVEQQLINLSIQEAQQYRILPLLGTDLYNKIKLDISGNTISGNYKTLLEEYIQPCLLQWSVYECIPYIRFKIMNKSVTAQRSDYSDPISLDEIRYYQEGIKNKAEFSGQRLIDYLLAHQTLFPEYTSNTDADDYKPETNSYSTGMILDNYDCEKFLGLNKNTKDLI